MKKYLLLIVISLLIILPSCKKDTLSISQENKENNFQEDGLSWTFKGLDKADMRNYKGALECFDRALDLDPDSVYTMNCKGLALVQVKDYEQALNLYDKAIDIDPEYTETYFNKANAFVALKSYDRALICFEKLVKLQPDHTGAWNSMGVIYMMIYKDYKKAISCYNRALQIDPSFAPALKNKEMILNKL